MARPLRVEYEGAIYHVMNRGDRREAIFCDDDDRRRFLHTLGEACAKAGWQAHAYCLMKNHFHLVLETPQPTLVDGMKWFLGTYTQRFNARHRMKEKARRLISAFLRSHKMGIEELRAMPKGEGRKVQLAAELRKQTTMTVRWIAQELNAGAPQTLWGSLRRFREIGDNTRD